MKITIGLCAMGIAVLCISMADTRHPTSWKKTDLYRRILRVLNEEEENETSYQVNKDNSLDLTNTNSLDLLDEEEETGIEKRK